MGRRPGLGDIEGGRLVKVGLTLGTNHAGVPSPEIFFTFIDRVEQAGFDSLWVGDHVIWSSPHLEGLTALAMYVARTKRLTVGTAVLILPLRHPLLVARMLGLMASLSNGRVVAGFGVGGENVAEFEACGVPHRQRGQIMDESLEVVRRLWTEDHVSHSGEHFRLEDVSLVPKPPNIPIWLGGRSEAAHHRAARCGDGWIDVFSSPRHFAEGKKAIEGLGAKAGFEWVQLEYMHVSGSREHSKARTLEHLNCTYKGHFDERVERVAAFGPAATIAERLHEFAEAGATHLIINPACPPEEKLEQLERIAADVLPLIRKM